MQFNSAMRFIYKLITTLVVLLLSGCSGYEETPNGGQDSGGGNTTVSSMALAEANLNQIIPGFPSVILEIIKYREYFANEEIKSLLGRIQDRIYAILISDIHFDDEYEIISQSISVEHIFLKRDGPCVAKDNNHATGSVKEFSIGSTVCLSLSELAKLPRESLEKEIVALLLHEFLHELGFDENDAAKLQGVIARNYNRIFPEGIEFYSFTNTSDNVVARFGSRTEFYDYKQKYYSQYSSFLDDLKTKEKQLTADDFNVVCDRASSMLSFVVEVQKYHIRMISRAATDLIVSGDFPFDEIKRRLIAVDDLVKKQDKVNFYFYEECMSQKNKLVTHNMIVNFEEQIKIIDDVFELTWDSFKRVNSYK